jgi:hypothetical protein
MSNKNPMPATDSARDLRNLVHDDATADFESDPKFVDSNPTENASSENLAVLRDTDDEEDSEDELEDDEDEEDEEEYEDDEDDVDEEEDGEVDDDDEEEDELDDDEEEDEEYEDDEDEVGSSRFVLKRAA